MAIRIEINKTILVQALEQAIGSVRRAQNTKKDPRMQPIFDADLKELLAGLASITEVK